MSTFRFAAICAAVGLSLAGSALASELTVQPAAVVEFTFGGSQAGWVHDGRMLARLEYAQNARRPYTVQDHLQPSLAEVEIATTGAGALRFNGLTLVSKTPLVIYAAEPAEQAESSWLVANWKTVALTAVGVAALAVSGGGGDDEDGGDPAGPRGGVACDADGCVVPCDSTGGVGVSCNDGG